jgi:lysophospholipase L1-like esterase
MFMGDVAVSTVEIEKTDAPTIYFAGDSTVTDQPAEYPYNPSSTYCGWGQMLGGLLKSGIAVSNHAQSGSTTQEFKECNWLVVKERLKKGDMLFVEFGHNDQKIDSLDAFGGYAENLRYYVGEARSVGAFPVICSPINRIIFQSDGTLLNLLGDYRNAAKQVADELNVPFVDMWSKTTEYFEADGAQHSWSWFWGDGENRDYTHTNDLGGALVAQLGAQEITQKKIAPVCEFVKTELIDVRLPQRSETAAVDSSAEMSHLATIGLVNVPKGAIPDIDKDIRGI